MGKYQRFQIDQYPREIDAKVVRPSKGSTIEIANNEFFQEDHSVDLDINILFGAMMAAFGIYLFFGFDDELTFGWVLFILFLILFGLLWTLYGFTAKRNKKKLILDRLNGTITYPDNYWRKPLKGSFTDLKVIISVTGDVDGVSTTEYLKFVNTFKPRLINTIKTISYENPYQEWSLYVWYMDKNRPLPPGTAFDPYRQKDFERRKAEGFPKPLYPSTIPTPEATPEQQKERERIGGW